MKYEDVVYAGAPIGPTLPSGFGLKGYRVVPLMTAGETIADVVAAYTPLVVRTSRASQSRSLSGDPTAGGINDDVAVNGPDWVRSPGFNALLIQAGQAGRTYRVWWAEDCFEIVDAASPPYLDGFVGAAASVAAPVAGSTSQLANSIANIPTLAGDGQLLPAGVKGCYAVASAQAAATILGPGAIVWWRYSSYLGRWAETTAQDALSGGRRDCATAEQLVNGAPGDRIFAEARSVTVSAGANLDVLIVFY